MKIGIDISKLHTFSKKRGIGFYTKNLCDSLKKNTELDVKLIEKKTNENFDLVHYPFFDLFRQTLPIKKKFPTIVTIHDVIPLIFPKQYPPGIKGKIFFQRQKYALQNVRGVITDSVSSKKDISKYLGLDLKLIYPIHLAPNLDSEVIDKIKQLKIFNKYNLTKKFALFVGNVNWNKNLINLTQASVNNKLDLVIVGSGFDLRDNLEHPELKSYKEFLSKFSDHKNVHVLNFVSEKVLATLYNLASMLLIPSYYEGFGLPILEAQAFGIPVVTSNISSMPEIAGDGAILVDPYDTSSIEKAIYNILKDKSLRKKLIKKGFENVKKYSWEKVALETAKIYEEISL